MKSWFYFIPILLITSCGGSSTSTLKKQLLGKWEYDITKMQQEAEGKPVSDADLKSMMGWINGFQGTTIHFKEGGDMLIETATIDSEGNWDLSKDEKFLMMKRVGDYQPVQIEEVSDSIIILSPEPDRGITFRRILRKVN